MCIEDIRLGRKTILYRNRVTIPAGGSIQLVPYAPDRVGLFVPNLGANTSIHLDTEDMGTVTEGLISLTNQSLDLEIKSDGVLVTSEWFAMNSGLVGFSINVWETRQREQ